MERKATRHDFEAVYQIYMDPDNNPFMSYELMDREEFEPLFAEMIDSGELYVYELEGRIAASYKVTRRAHRMSHIAYLGGFAVHPEFRGRGIGSRVLNDLEARLRQDGAKRFELLVVSDNPKAIEFYLKHGFEHEGTLKKFLKRSNSECYLDELMMAKLLSW